MNFKMVMALVCGIVVSAAWASATSHAADSGTTYTTIQSQVVIR